MDPIWYEFRSSPNAFLIKNKTNVESLLHDLLQILYSEDKDAMLKLNVLVILQEYASFLLDDLNRTELVLATLRNIFDNYRSVADQLFISEVLVTITDVLVQSEFIESLQQFLMEFVSLLFEIIEKIKSEPNRLLRAIACDCLKELESSIPVSHTLLFYYNNL
jgi:AP-5 complex subunit beta-1